MSTIFYLPTFSTLPHDHTYSHTYTHMYILYIQIHAQCVPQIFEVSYFPNCIYFIKSRFFCFYSCPHSQDLLTNCRINIHFTVFFATAHLSTIINGIYIVINMLTRFRSCQLESRGCVY